MQTDSSSSANHHPSPGHQSAQHTGHVAPHVSHTSTQLHSRPTSKNPALKYIALILVAILLAGLGWYYLQPRTMQLAEGDVFAEAQQVIAVVGEERIFASDLDQIRPLVPEFAEEDHGMEMLVNHSVILQAAQADGLIEIPAELFDTPFKSQNLRLELVNQVKEDVESKLSRVRGSVVTIYFLNEYPGSIGYEAGREFARTKINAIHRQVINGEITMQQAGQLVANDPELERVDVMYKSNAYFEFDAGPDDQISSDPNLDPEIRSLSVGEVSQVLTGRGFDLTDWEDNLNNEDFIIEPQDAMFLFAQVSERTTDLEFNTFTDWLETKKAGYEIRYE